MSVMRLRELGEELAGRDSLRIRNRLLFSSVESTNGVGKTIAAQFRQKRLALPGVFILALQQSAGRGRLGNRWLSPPGGIYLSVVHPVADPAELSDLPIRTASILCRELDGWVEDSCRIKWPNDLIVRGRKIGGILIETVGSRDQLAAIVGLGINHSGDLEPLPESATSLSREAVAPPSFVDATHRLMAALETSVVGSTGGTMVEEYSQWSLLEVGDTIHCRTARQTHQGTFLGFDRRGFLRLRSEGRERLISAGEIIEGEGVEDDEA